MRKEALITLVFALVATLIMKLRGFENDVALLCGFLLAFVAFLFFVAWLRPPRKNR